MDDRVLRLISENLARAVDRRTVLKRMSQVTFAGLVTLAAGHGLPQIAAAARGGPQPAWQIPNCNPPGPYCNYEGGNPSMPDSCHGGHCFQHKYNGKVYNCQADTSYYQMGCWTSSGVGGYWVCCDCICGTPTITTCGCVQFSGDQPPQPDHPGQ